MSDEETPSASINFVPCVYFMKRGVAKENPEKITLTAAELAKVINDTKGELSDMDDDDEEGNGAGGSSSANAADNGNDDDDDDDEDDDGDESMDVSDSEAPRNRARAAAAAAAAGRRAANPDDEYNFADYDDESSAQVAGIGDIAVIDEENPLNDEDDVDSEAEDDIIKPTDNLLLVGHVEDDAATMEVFVYNEEEGSFYVHHDFLLPSFPLCIEWMNYDPEAKDTGNMCAIGSMDPVITVWDLDIQDSLEPALKLGAKRNRRKNVEAYGHTDAVLDMSWNENFTHILASASVDQTVILWDLDVGRPHTTITAFDEKVQSVKFHAAEANLLLTGSCDGTVKLFDCRDPDTIATTAKVWSFGGEIERVLWDPSAPNCFLASTNTGKVFYADIRQADKLWSKRVHEQEVTGLSVNGSCAGMLSTSSSDGTVKVWQYDGSGAKLVHEDSTSVGRIQCMATCPENPLLLAVGGDNKSKNLRLINVADYENVKRTFGLQQ